jgi:hypothetical protein
MIHPISGIRKSRMKPSTSIRVVKPSGSNGSGEPDAAEVEGYFIASEIPFTEACRCVAAAVRFNRRAMVGSW